MNLYASISAAAFTAINHAFPVALPLFAPAKRALAHRAGLGGEVLFGYTFHEYLDDRVGRRMEKLNGLLPLVVAEGDDNSGADQASGRASAKEWGCTWRPLGASYPDDTGVVLCGLRFISRTKSPCISGTDVIPGDVFPNLIKIDIGTNPEEVRTHLGGFRRCSDLRRNLALVLDGSTFPPQSICIAQTESCCSSSRGASLTTSLDEL